MSAIWARTTVGLYISVEIFKAAIDVIRGSVRQPRL